MKNLLRLLKILQDYEVGAIYINDNLESFDEFMGNFKNMDVQKVLEKDEQTFYLLLDDGTVTKVSVKSLEEEEELAM
ncbi:hypothetical protein [Clostridium beijerinckii]|uniref:hypothetical protein n=1 Tax=Clostridium beijerinckii TaxID=1520 RepID=UPI00098CB90B|nr:hypothetical protein [Clostridium beijerinckii]NRT79450.1 hypothetical protein [Clostridium beijerinckii]OOM41540.1 hypothetical protein CBEIJ_44700 [Clostridium beijerinckii]